LKKFSKWLHKYIGLLLLVFLIWMSISGILLNHPDLISGLDVPEVFIPRQYLIDNWERGAINTAVFSKQHPATVITAGKMGVWRSNDSGRSFRSFMGKGFADHKYDQKTSSILMTSVQGKELIVACTYGGVYYRQLNQDTWHKAQLPDDEERPMKALVARSKLFLFTESNVYSSELNPDVLEFKIEHVPRNGANNVTMIKLFFDLHGGEVWGLPGKLLFDLVGILLIVLCVTAFYTWYYPKKLKLRLRWKIKNRRKNPRVFKFLLKYHLDFGIWSAAILLLMSVTGLFMRPPLLVAIANDTVSASMYSGPLPDNPWHKKIRNAAYDPASDSFIIDCRDGVYQGPADFSRSFKFKPLPVPVFVMGATVMECDSTGILRLGSFNGLYRIHMKSKAAVDDIHGTVPQNVSALRPGKYILTGYFATPDSAEFITTHDGGLLHLYGNSRFGPFPMPDELRLNQSMPLWNYLFELHNGRLFQDLIGNWYILFVPLGALLTTILILTGIIDWLIVWLRNRRTRLKHETQ
jgi:hypothetical protein